MNKSRRLSDKLKEVGKVSFGRSSIAAMHAILDENRRVIDRLNVMKNKMQEVMDVVQKRVDELLAAGGCLGYPADTASSEG